MHRKDANELNTTSKVCCPAQKNTLHCVPIDVSHSAACTWSGMNTSSLVINRSAVHKIQDSHTFNEVLNLHLQISNPNFSQDNEDEDAPQN